ncbi:MAG TPA: LytTR family DNA-binding domain-containing protein [Steroidobacteraceae bacterium]|nr:LytTR family DNA-binding domain-containing protein [Steroidobacteraceae bacterium]
MRQQVLVVDDEAPARERLQRLLGELPDCEVAGTAANGEQAVRLAGELRPDVLLLDVRMPGMNGLEVARHVALLAEPPAVVFTTAYDAYAVEAFEAQAIGYLLKPVRAEKLAAALQRAARLAAAPVARIAAADPAHAPRTHVAARLGDSVRLIPVSDVYYFAADQKYTTVRHKGGSELIEDPLRSLAEEFGARFVRVHRNALVNTQCIAAIERDAAGQYYVAVRDVNERLAVSRRLASELRERLRL